MSVTNPSPLAPYLPAATATLHSAAASAGNSTAQVVGRYRMMTIEVTGITAGYVYARARLTVSSSYTDIPVFDKNGVPVARMTKNGLYQVRVSGFYDLITRVEPSSDTITVKATMSMGDLSFAGARQVELAQVAATAITTGANTNVTSYIDVSGFTYIRVRAHASATIAETFTVRGLFSMEPDSADQTYGGAESYVNFLTTDLRGVSDLIEVKGKWLIVNVLNSGASTYSFELYVVGVR